MNVPAVNAPMREPSSSAAANVHNGSSFHLTTLYSNVKMGRTHETRIPSTEVPPGDEVLHDKYVRYHALVVAERKTSYRRENGAP